MLNSIRKSYVAPSLRVFISLYGLALVACQVSESGSTKAKDNAQISKDDAVVSVVNDMDLKSAAEIVANGRGEIPACKFCHGIKGQGDHHGGIPRLAGLHPYYIIKQLEDFERAPQSTGVQEAPQKRDISGATQSVVGGSRSYSEMNRIARLLTPKEKKQLAYYFSQLPFQAGQIKEA